MGRVHLTAILSSPALDLAGVVEPDQSIRAALAADGIAAHAELGSLLAAAAPECAVVAAPSDLHLQVVRELAAAGIAVLCEKPLGVQVEDALAAGEAARDAGVLLQIGYWRRYVPELRALRARIAGGEFGAVCQIACMQWDHEPPDERFRAHSGGIAIDMAVHELDQASWLLGERLEWVDATPAGPPTGRPRSDPDAAVIVAGLSGGAVATISLGRRFPLQDSCWAEVWGTRGYERVTFMWDADGERVFAQAIRDQLESFARAVRGAPPEGAGGEDAVSVLDAAARAQAALERLRRDGETPAS